MRHKTMQKFADILKTFAHPLYSTGKFGITPISPSIYTDQSEHYINHSITFWSLYNYGANTGVEITSVINFERDSLLVTIAIIYKLT